MGEVTAGHGGNPVVLIKISSLSKALVDTVAPAAWAIEPPVAFHADTSMASEGRFAAKIKRNADFAATRIYMDIVDIR